MFVVVDVILVNQGDDPGSVSSFLQMELKDNTGQVYDQDFSASAIAGKSPGGEISPGERIRGQVGFQVPEDAAGLVFVFDEGLFTSGKAFVELGPEPINLDPPDSLPGERPLPTFAIGDIIQIGDLTIVVNEVTSPGGDRFNQPDAGKKFVAVDVTLENIGSESENISSLLQMYMKDSTGQVYDEDFAATLAAGNSPSGEIVPGEQIRGQVGFQVPEDAQDLVFVFDPDIFGEGKLFVALE